MGIWKLLELKIEKEYSEKDIKIEE